MGAILAADRQLADIAAGLATRRREARLGRKGIITLIGAKRG